MKRSQVAFALASMFRFNVAPTGFDPAAIIGATFEGEGDTRRFQYPPAEYMAFAVGPFGEDKKSRIEVSAKGAVQLLMVWQPDAPELREKLKMEKLPTITQRVFLDVTETGGLDMGQFKNADLNKLREVFGLNKAGLKWSFNDLVGKPAKIKIEQKPNPQDANAPYTNVTAVIPA